VAPWLAAEALDGRNDLVFRFVVLQILGLRADAAVDAALIRGPEIRATRAANSDRTRRAAIRPAPVRRPIQRVLPRSTSGTGRGREFFR
jgi:hypothetical protein